MWSNGSYSTVSMMGLPIQVGREMAVLCATMGKFIVHMVGMIMAKVWMSLRVVLLLDMSM